MEYKVGTNEFYIVPVHYEVWLPPLSEPEAKDDRMITFTDEAGLKLHVVMHKEGVLELARHLTAVAKHEDEPDVAV